MRVRSTVAWLILLVGFAVPVTLYADPITYEFSGPVVQRHGTAPQAIGDFAAGSLTFNSGTLSIVEDFPHSRMYVGTADLQLTVRRPSSGATVVNYIFPQQALGIRVTDSGSTGSEFVDWYFLGTVNPEAVLDGPLRFRFGLSLEDRTGRALSSTAIPASVNPANFQNPYFGLEYFQGQGESLRQTGLFLAAVGSLNGIEVEVPNPVPEPASLLLCGAGLAGLAVRRWRTRRSAP